MRVIVVGGGVLGTMHSWFAVERGHEVVQIEREAAARGASVRNFGLVWVSGRSDGAELETALRGREHWAGLGEVVPDLGFRASGSLTVVRTEAELAVAKVAVSGDTAARREFDLLDPRQSAECNPALRGEYLGALWCGRDAQVEPRTAQQALRFMLLGRPGYTWLPGREVHALTSSGVLDDHGERHHGDAVVLCTGAWLSGLVRSLAPRLPVRRVRLQMMQTAPLNGELTTPIADGDSLRYYPAYDARHLDTVQPQPALAAERGMQLLMVQRRDGGLTIGDTHAYDEPFDFDVDEAPYVHLAGTAEALLGTSLPAITRRWAGVYAQCLDPALVVHREEVAEGVFVVTGPGGRGMTCSPAIALDTLDVIGA